MPFRSPSANASIIDKLTKNICKSFLSYRVGCTLVRGGRTSLCVNNFTKLSNSIRDYQK